MRSAVEERPIEVSERSAGPAVEGRLGTAPGEEAPHRETMVAERSPEDLRRDNARLVWGLLKARDRIRILEKAVAELSAPPCTYGTFCALNEDGTATVYAGGQKLKVNLHPSLDPPRLQKGQEVVLNHALNVVGVSRLDGQGEVVRIKELLGDGRAIIAMGPNGERTAELAEPLRQARLAVGDRLLFDPRSGLLLERLPKAEVADLLLEEVADITYADIGGLHPQIQMIHDAIELPYLHAEAFREHRLQPPKGVLLYGPPGCGKTLIAKAVANSLARRMAHETGQRAKGYFLNIKGPELLNKYVGETERKIREVFRQAKEKAAEDAPVVVFFDEMESLFRTRGSGISSDMESTVVPQFLAELDGVEGLKNVIVIGASNRQDLVDPAVLRPGRFDVKIKIDRPTKDAARDIFSKYLTADLPLHADLLAAHGGDRAAAARALIEAALESLYAAAEGNRFLEITHASGEKEITYLKDFVSGAMIESICTRAKRAAVKRMVETGERGITAQDLLQAVQGEFRENVDLPNTGEPDDWAGIAGHRGQRIVHVRSVRPSGQRRGREAEVQQAGHYL